MKRLIALAALALCLSAPAAFGQGIQEERGNSPTNLYITSMFRVRVYLNNRVIDVLPPGKRAKVIHTRGQWLYVQYTRGDQTYHGWIRR